MEIWSRIIMGSRIIDHLILQRSTFNNSIRIYYNKQNHQSIFHRLRIRLRISIRSRTRLYNHYNHYSKLTSNHKNNWIESNQQNIIIWKNSKRSKHYSS